MRLDLNDRLEQLRRERQAEMGRLRAELKQERIRCSSGSRRHSALTRGILASDLPRYGHDSSACSSSVIRR